MDFLIWWENQMALLQLRHCFADFEHNFEKLNSHRERIDFVRTIIAEYPSIDRLVQFKRERKDEVQSEHFRNIGNAYYELKNYQNALEAYTKSIAYATGNAGRLALAHANRSAVLFQKKLYRECLKDIQYALDAGYSGRHRAQLEERKRKAEMAKENQPEVPYHPPIPALSFPAHQHIECAADCVKLIRRNGAHGRHVVASKDIPVGSVIAIEEPFAKALSPATFFTHCFHCMHQSYNLIPCDECPLVLFCSKQCKQDAWDAYHKHECSILAAIVGSSIVHKAAVLSVLRMAFAECRKLGTLEHLESAINSHGNVYKSSSYVEVHAHATNSTKQQPAASLFCHATICAHIFNLVEQHTNYFLGHGNELKDLFKEVLGNVMSFASHQVLELVMISDKGFPPFLTNTGVGLYSFSSSFDHSCSPNVLTVYHGSSIVVRTTRPIKTGQKLFRNYGNNYANYEKRERQKWLKMNYHFDCKCEACSNDWQLRIDLPRRGHALFTKMIQGDAAAGRSLFAIMKKKAEVLETQKPCQEFVEVQMVLRSCLTALANRRNLL